MKWILCSQELLDADQTVLIHRPGHDDPVYPGYYDGEDWWTIEGQETRNVTHWMAFPEPPEA